MAFYPQIIGAEPSWLAAARANARSTAEARGQYGAIIEARAKAAEVARQGDLARAQQMLAALEQNKNVMAQMALTQAATTDMQMGRDPFAMYGGGSYPTAANYAQQLTQAVPYAGGGSVQVQQSAAMAQRETCPFPATVVAAGASATISALPQRPQQVGRLVIPSSIAAFFVIDDLEVAKNSEFTAAGSVPAEVFSEVATDTTLKGATAGPGVSIIIQVTNISAAPQTFRGAIIGLALS